MPSEGLVWVSAISLPPGAPHMLRPVRLWHNASPAPGRPVWKAMSLIVQKFGGTSVGSPERIKDVARRVARWRSAGHDVVVVPSAMSGETNRLIALAKEIQQHPNPRELDVVAATGEQVTIGLLAMAINDQGVKACSYTGAQVRVLTDSAFTKARILHIDEQRLRHDLSHGVVPVVAGFQGID